MIVMRNIILNANSFMAGVDCFVEGLKLISRPKIRRFVILPALINIVIFTLLPITEIHFLSNFVHWLNQYLPSWLSWLSDILATLLFLASLIIFVFCFTTLANIIAGPFNGLLSEKVERQLPQASLATNLTLWQLIKALPKIITRALRMLWYYLPRLVACLILFWVPVVNVIAPVILFLFNAWMIAVMYVDFPSDNHNVSFPDMLLLLRQHAKLALGFGCPALFMTMIPIVNFIVMPAAVAGATVMRQRALLPTHTEQTPSC